MKNFGKFITKKLAEGATPKQIAKAAAAKGGTKATLKASLAKFVDPNKVKIGNKKHDKIKLRYENGYSPKDKIKFLREKTTSFKKFL